MPEDISAQDVVPVTQLPSDSWFESITLRPNGKLLACRLDEPELYTFDPEDPKSKPQLLHNFEQHANGVIHACPVPGSTDEYFILSGVVDLANVEFEDFIIWRVVLSPDDSSSPKVSKVADIRGTGYSIGVHAISDRVVIIPDSFENCIRRLDTQTGQLSLLVTDDSMKIANGVGNFFGINQMRITDEFIWFTNTSAGLLCRIPIERVNDDPSVGIRTSGPVQILADDIPHCDGLALSRDQTTVYTCSYKDGFIWKISIDPSTGKGQTSIVMRDLASPTAMELAYINDRPKLFVTCCGEVKVRWATRVEQDPRGDISSINAAVTVTVETRVEVTESK